MATKKAVTKSVKPRRKAVSKSVKLSDVASPIISDSIVTTKKNKKALYLVAVGVAVLAGLMWINKGLWLASTVNGKPIWRHQVVKELEKQAGAQALDELVTRELIQQKSDNLGIVITMEDINAEIDKFKKDLEATGLEYDTYLLQQGIVQADVEDGMRFRLMINKIIEPQVQITEEEVKEYYETNKLVFGNDSTYEGVKSEVESQLKQTKISQKTQEWLAQVREESKVVTYAKY